MRLSRGTRAAVIGGANGTSNVRAGKLFDIPVLGTHAHSLVQVYGNDYEAFKAYAATHKNCVFLVDTYDTLRIGVPAAIQVARELGDQINFMGVRIDSGILPTFPRKSVSNWTKLALQRLRFMPQMTWMKIPSSTSRCKKPRLMSGVWVPS